MSSAADPHAARCNRDSLYQRLILVAVTLLIFCNVLKNDFVWDDKLFIVGVPAYRKIDWYSVFFHPYNPINGIEYLPIRDLSYVLDYIIWGQSEFGFHLTNLLLYVLTVVIVYEVVRQMMRLFNCSMSEGLNRYLPVCTSLMFAVHPLHSQVVAFVMQRNTLLAGLFSLLTLYSFVRLLADSKKPFFWVLAAFVFFVSGCFSKGIAVTVPLVLALILLSSYRRYESKFWITLIPFFAVAFFTAILFRDIAYQTGFISSDPMDFGAYNPYVRVVRAVQIPWFYIAKFLAPYNLSPEYSIPFATSIGQGPVLVSLTLSGLAVYLGFRFRRSHPLAICALGSIWLLLLPVMNLVPTSPAVADRYAYLPSFGLCLLMAYTLLSLSHGKRPVIVVLILCVTVWGSLAIRENSEWLDDRTLFAEMVRREPASARGYARLGHVALQEGNRDEATRLFKKAGELDPLLPDFDCQAGSRLLKSKDYKSAIASFQKALYHKENHIVSLFLCGIAYVKLKDFERGAEYFGRALASTEADIGKLKPQVRAWQDNFIRPYLAHRVDEITHAGYSATEKNNRLATLYYRFRLFDDAIKIMDGQNQVPDYNINYMRAEIFASKHNYKKSLLYYEQCINDKPDDALSYFGAGAACEKLFRFSQALEYYKAASRLNDNWPAPAYRRGVIWFLKGKEVNARSAFAEVRNYPEFMWRVSAYENKMAQL